MGFYGRPGRKALPESTIRVEEALTRKQKDSFVKFPWVVYREDPLWVPPLLMERKAFINPKKNPFFQHAEVALFLALRNGKPAGRIAALVNHNHNSFHQDRVGFFGLFECINDQEVSQALLDRASEWLRRRGMEVMRGPASFSTNEEIGLLVEGFQESPMILMPYNPPYYAQLLEQYGFRKEKDLYAFIRTAEDMPERLYKLAEKLKEKNRFKVRKLKMAELKEEILRFKSVYEAAWERNWGFVPMTEAEIDHMASELKRILDPDLVFFVEVDDKIVGFSLTLPDVNQALKKVNGRLFPTGFIKLMYHFKKIDQVRVLLLGVAQGYRRKGIDAVLYLETFKEGVKKGYKRGEFSWILEDNEAMIRPLEAIGASLYKTYRVYDLPL
jgi:GNAT superfamily N-acetyltransferase